MRTACFARFFLVVIVFLATLNPMNAQESKLLSDKPGTFKLLDWGVYTHYNCGFTKAETTANYQELVRLTDAVRRNPVIGNPKGFDCHAVIYSQNCDLDQGYGIPCQISFEFRSWSLKNGKAVQWTVEPPSWSIYVNNLKSFTGSGFNFSSYPPSDMAAGFDLKPWENATRKVNQLFYQPGKKESIGRGVDRYNGETVIVFNPGRPAYWIPVTIREAFSQVFAYWKLNPDRIASEMVLKELQKEYDKFTETEREGFAYSGDPGSISGIGSDNRELPLMKVNPLYWDKSLPRSSIQILGFYCPADKESVRNEGEVQLKNNQGECYLNRFIESLDVNILAGSVLVK